MAVELTDLRKKVFEDRYQYENETVEGMWARLANAAAEVEDDKDIVGSFMGILEGFKFVPGGRILANLGTPFKTTPYNCYVIDFPEDSRDGILDNVKKMTNIMARGGGVGVNLSSLRPRGSFISTVNGTSSGPVSWAQIYSTITKDIIQQGGSRRGALMLMLDDNHPDLMEFIKAKEDLNYLNGANLSVCVSDDFMRAVKEDLFWDLYWHGETTDKIPARAIWDAICESAWKCGEPGVVFLDRCNKESNLHHVEELISVNPCGEQPLPAGGVCNLGAMNLSAYVGDDGTFKDDQLARDVQVAVRFLDNVIEINKDDDLSDNMKVRRIGLGTMGLADALIKMEIRYGSEDSLSFIKQVYRTIADNAYQASANLAEEEGAFPLYVEADVLSRPFVRKKLSLTLLREIEQKGLRNGVLLTQAPTGSTSMLSGVSSGIEPNYAFSYIRQDRLGTHEIKHPLVDKYLEGKSNSFLPDYFVTSMDLTPEEHVTVQAAIQKWTDASISKTVNAPNDHTVEQVKELYTKAYDMGCKGITYFRDGCREGVLSLPEPEKVEVMAPETKDKFDQELDDLKDTPVIAERPASLDGITYRVRSPEGNVFVTINKKDNGPFELFASVGKAGSDVASYAEALGRLISLTLRVPSSMDREQRLSLIGQQLVGIGGSRFEGFGENRVRSLADAIATAITYYEQETQPNDVATEEVIRVDGELCPECGNVSLVRQEGCKSCTNCGYSEC